MALSSPTNPLAEDLDFILKQTANLWDALSGKNIFLTGGTGWFGRWLLETFSWANVRIGAGVKVTVLTRNARAFSHLAPALVSQPFLTLHQGDIRDFNFPSGRFTHLIHAASTSAQETFAGEPPLAKFDTLVTGTRRVLDFASQAGIRQVLFTSSGAVYGATQYGQNITEETPSSLDSTSPDSALGIAKQAAEFLISNYALQNNWNASIARCFSFVGPFMPQNLHYAIGDFIRQATTKKTITIQSDGQAIRSYMYCADLVIWLLILLQRQGMPRVYNVGSDRAISLYNLARNIQQLINPEIIIKALCKKGTEIGNPLRSYYVPSLERAKNDFGIDIFTPFEKSIEKTLNITRQQDKQDDNYK